MMTSTPQTPAHAGTFLSLAMTAAAAWAFTGAGAGLAAGQAAASPQVEIKKHSTGKEATITYGDGEWFIHIDVDQDRTMIIRTESHDGKETKNQPEIVERPMSNAEVDRIINDWISGIQSTLKP
ncbi:MAG: hypothetical protein E6K68_03375 [Nitrospirae bacterium]|nr:MAG: hypothetical protein E6K68_03375 [Nitrospirota bacterium]